MTDFTLNGRMDPDTSTVCQSPDAIAAEVDGETVILNRSTGSYSCLDVIGSTVWNHLEQPISLAGLAGKIRAEYEVDEAQCMADLIEFMDELLDNRLIIIQNTAGLEPQDT